MGHFDLLSYGAWLPSCDQISKPYVQSSAHGGYVSTSCKSSPCARHAATGLKGQAAAAATRKANMDKRRGAQQQNAVAQANEKLRQREQRLQQHPLSPLQSLPGAQMGRYPMFPGDRRSYRPGVRPTHWPCSGVLRCLLDIPICSSSC